MEVFKAGMFLVGFLPTWFIFPFTISGAKRYHTSRLEMTLLRFAISAGVGLIGVAAFEGKL